MHQHRYDLVLIINRLFAEEETVLGPGETPNAKNLSQCFPCQCFRFPPPPPSVMYRVIVKRN
ncbi:polyprotein [Anopheles sinensis]|uniref:Polyprotein n=1 Tax=Anopheles sinensis TaxID=74873 RepID=A0A084W2Z4_ANOSI|nr:polyprotein [Anopheles sinensis]